MAQQVNLYQPASYDTPQTLAGSSALAGAVVIAGALLLIWGYGSWQVSRLARAVATIGRQSQAQRQMLTGTESMRTSQTPEQIEARVTELAAEVAARTRALELLRGGAAGQTTGFAARMEALARRHIDGIWLDHILLSSGTSAMSLSGSSLDADLVPRYLQSLATDPALRGARFDEFVIQQPVQEEPSTQGAIGLHFRAGNKDLAGSKTPEHS